MEPGVDRIGLLPDAVRDIYHTQWRNLIGAFIYPIGTRTVFSNVFDRSRSGIYRPAAISRQTTEVSSRDGVLFVARGGVPVQQLGTRRNRLCGVLGNTLSCFVGGCPRSQNHGWSAIFQQG